MKECNKCLVTKPIEDFFIKKSSKDGYAARCKICQLKEKQDFYRTKEGYIKGIYRTQKQRSKKRGDIAPTYTSQELIDWAYSQELFHKLYDNWKRLDFQKEYAPSFDRKDDYAGYSIANIQLMTWEDNRGKFHADERSGKNSKRSKTVYQYSMSGEYLASFKSPTVAGRVLNIHRDSINNVCNKRAKSAGGFYFTYTDKETRCVEEV